MRCTPIRLPTSKGLLRHTQVEATAEQAIREAREADRVEPRAAAARYDPEHALILVELRSAVTFGFSPERVPGLERARPGQPGLPTPSPRHLAQLTGESLTEKEAFARASELPPEEQEAFARLLLDELDSEVRWAQAFARSQEALAKLADVALAEFRAGETEILDPDGR